MGDAATTAGPGAMVVARSEEIEYRRGLEPTDIEAAYKVAAAVALTGMYGVTSAEDALLRIMTGRELELTCMQSLRGLFSVEKKIGMDASLMHALCLRSPLCEQFECTLETHDRVEYTIRRRGWATPKTITWTIEDATRAGLLGRGETEIAKKQNNWNKYPRQMLHARCKADGARQVFPERLFGLYSKEEIVDGAVVDHDTQTSKLVSDPTGYAARNDRETVESEIMPAMQRAEATCDGFLSRIAKATTVPERTAIRAEISQAEKAGELRGPYLEKVKAAYNAKYKGQREGAAGAGATPLERAPTEPAPAPAPPPAEGG